MVLLLAFWFQLLLPEWPWLARLQADPTYKLVTGLIFCLYLTLMWLLFLFREIEVFIVAKQLFRWHEPAGFMGPLLFYLHADRLGHGYQLLLGLVFFANILLGLAYPLIHGLKSQRWHHVWLVLHIALAAVLPLLIGFHIYIVYAFK